MEENKIQEAEIISENIAEEKQPMKEKSKFFKRLALIFLLGFLLGIALKIEALKKITIGYNDYLMKSKTQDYNINQFQMDLAKNIEAQAQEQNAQNETGDAINSENIPAPDDQANN